MNIIKGNEHLDSRDLINFYEVEEDNLVSNYYEKFRVKFETFEEIEELDKTSEIIKWFNDLKYEIEDFIELRNFIREGEKV